MTTEGGGAYASWKIARVSSFSRKDDASFVQPVASLHTKRLRFSAAYPTIPHYSGRSSVTNNTYSRHGYVFPPHLPPRTFMQRPTTSYTISQSPAERTRRLSFDSGQNSSWSQQPATQPLTQQKPKAVVDLVEMYSEQLQHPDRGIPTQERRVATVTKRVFTGADALVWFSDNMVGVVSIEHAMRVGTQLLKAGIIVNVSGQGNTEFCGSPNALYLFSSTTHTSPQSQRNYLPSKTTLVTERQDKGKGRRRETGQKCIVQ